MLPAGFVLVWSSGYLAGTVGTHNGPPLTLVFWRFALAFVVLGVVAVVTRAPWPRQPRTYLHLLVTGVLLLTLQFGPVYLGLSMGVSAGLSALIVSACPLVVSAAAVPLFGERLSGRQWLGLAVGLAGVGVSLSENVGGGTLGGCLLIGLGLLGFAAGTVYQKRFGQTVDMRVGMTVQLFAGLVSTLPLAAFHDGLTLPMTVPVVGSVVWLALVNSIGGFLMLFLLLRLRSGGAATSLLYLVPPVTALLAVPVLGQGLSAAVVLGMAVSAIGVVLVVARPLFARPKLVRAL
jgi:drug/metabolite transporter (DMT)-like permease